MYNHVTAYNGGPSFLASANYTTKTFSVKKTDVASKLDGDTLKAGAVIADANGLYGILFEDACFKYDDNRIVAGVVTGAVFGHLIDLTVTSGATAEKLTAQGIHIRTADAVEF